MSNSVGSTWQWSLLMWHSQQCYSLLLIMRRGLGRKRRSTIYQHECTFLKPIHHLSSSRYPSCSSGLETGKGAFRSSCWWLKEVSEDCVLGGVTWIGLSTICILSTHAFIFMCTTVSSLISYISYFFFPTLLTTWFVLVTVSILDSSTWSTSLPTRRSKRSRFQYTLRPQAIQYTSNPLIDTYTG